MKKRMVVALGGNALGNTLPEQMAAVKITAKIIVDLMAAGYELIIVHGNGPQVGIINNAMTDYADHIKATANTPLSVCVAMSQAYIGYDLQNSIHEEFLTRRQEPPPIATIITQTRVDADDPAFRSPTKPIGTFMTQEEARAAAGERGWVVQEDAGRGYRRVVASPQPREIIELDAIRAMVDNGSLVICCGGGGIPVIRQGNHLAGAVAVLDKDLAASLLADSLDADILLILTTVEKAALHYRQPDEQLLDRLTAAEARNFAQQGHFAPGSMLPKIEAGAAFVHSHPGRRAIITLLQKAMAALQGQTGTEIIP